VDLARANAWWDVTPQVLYERIGPDNTFGFGVSIPLRIFDRNQGEIARTQGEVSRAAALQQVAAVQALADVDVEDRREADGVSRSANADTRVAADHRSLDRALHRLGAVVRRRRAGRDRGRQQQ